MKLEQGDAFERANSGWIRQTLPHYEPLWSLYIGHSGHGWPLPISGLEPEKEKNRKKLYQAHYTAAVGCYQIERIFEEIDSKLGSVSDITAFLVEHRHLNCLMGYIGQVRDMYKFMDEALGQGESILRPLQDFYSLRSHILHGPRMPVRIEEGLIKIPKIAKQNKRFDEWDDKSYWDDFSATEFVFISDFCEQTKNEFFDLIRSQHAKIYSTACDYFGDSKVQETEMKEWHIENNATTFPAISAWIKPSGQYKC